VVLSWLLESGLGPAAVAVPVNWATEALAGAAKRWFRRLRRKDDLSRLLRAATGTSVDLSHAEFDALRRLLEDPQTWVLAGRGTMEDLISQIASCLPPRDGRTAEDSHAAAMTIGRGLLEFTVAELEPDLFQQVLMARLHRMETGLADALDEALLELNADLIARFDELMGQFKRVLDRLPPGPAQRSEIVVYLKTLIDWLNKDPWPRDQRFRGPVLTPATIERKLRVTSAGDASTVEFHADALARRCRRLVILGGPGSGKTWLAKRTARLCAERAFRALAMGASAGEVEIPLYITCSHLFRADGDIREVAVSSALSGIGDLGGSRVTAALRILFTERNAPTVLVIDALDEARGPDDRLRLADTLPWRLILTSRPSSWNQQVAIHEGNDSERVGELQPLRYPADVEPFIRRWFAQRPEWGKDLAAQIARRRGLQETATIPLILAFFCIIGGAEPLPEVRSDLYTRVLKRMLTGRWRDSSDRRPDPDTCLQTLRAWAWAGATSCPVSGVGTWPDDILTERIRLERTDEDALDHIATPLGPADVDTGEILRRFIHRSLREHLVAEHIASIPVSQAAQALLPHIWYDPDWEYAAPAAIAMHSEREQLLRTLIRSAARSDEIPGDISVIDAKGQFQRILARIAAESREADWPSDLARILGQARLQLTRLGLIQDLGGSSRWSSWNDLTRDVLLGLLTSQTRSTVKEVVNEVVQLAPEAEDKRQVREALLGLLATQNDWWAMRNLISGVIQLAPEAEDKRQVREALLALLTQATDGSVAAALVSGIMRLVPAGEDKRQVREALLALLTQATNGSVATELSNRLASTALKFPELCPFSGDSIS
jgi:NACHT domain